MGKAAVEAPFSLVYGSPVNNHTFLYDFVPSVGILELSTIVDDN